MRTFNACIGRQMSQLLRGDGLQIQQPLLNSEILGTPVQRPRYRMKGRRRRRRFYDAVVRRRTTASLARASHIGCALTETTLSSAESECTRRRLHHYYMRV